MKYIRRLTIIVLVLVIGGYIAACCGLYIFQRSLIFRPRPRSADSQSAVIALPNDVGNFLVSTRPRDGQGALIYFGGNSEDVSMTVPAYAATFPDRSIYMMHYRGYGGSDGSPSEEGIVADGVALFDEVSKTHSDVVIVGRSLGSGIAVHVAGLKTPSHLVLVTPYDSMGDIAAHRYPYFPVRWLLIDKFDSWRYAPGVTAKTLIIIAEEDSVIPRERSVHLFGLFNAGLASFRVLPGTDHGSISGSPEYYPLIREYVDEDGSFRETPDQE